MLHITSSANYSVLAVRGRRRVSSHFNPRRGFSETQHICCGRLIITLIPVRRQRYYVLLRYTRVSLCSAFATRAFSIAADKGRVGASDADDKFFRAKFSAENLKQPVGG